MSVPRDLALAVQLRARRGAARVRESGVPIIEASIAAAIAWAISHYLLGRPSPFFAPVAAWTCLGFTRDRDVRAVAELAFGVSIGIGLGDLVVHQVGSGAWQIAAILALTATIARFASPARLVVAQAGVQAIIVVALPSGGGPLGRWTDALVGGAVALAFCVLVPRDVRGRPRQVAREGFGEVAAILRQLAGALETRDLKAGRDALARGRASQGLIDAWGQTSRATEGLVRVSPLARRHQAELSRLAQAETYGDRSLRSARVVARRGVALLERAERPEVDWTGLAAAVRAVADCSRLLADAYGSGTDPAKVLGPLRAAGALMTDRLGAGGWDAHAFVLLLRSVVIDLMRAAGLDYDEARAQLPRL